MSTRKHTNETHSGTTLSVDTVVYGVMAYAVTTEPYIAPHYSYNYDVDLTEVYRRLEALEAKLDELLRRSDPNADVLDDIRKRVNDAIDSIRPAPKRKR